MIATENAAAASTCSPRAAPHASDTHPTIGAPATQPTYPAAVNVPTAETTWVACRLTVLITSGQNNDAPPAPSASPTAAAPAAGATDSNKIPPPATHPPTTNAVRLDIRPSSGPPAPRVVAAINCPTTYAPAPNKTPVAKWFRKNNTPHVSTPPSVTSANANTNNNSISPSRRSRRNGCDLINESAPADAAAIGSPESVVAAHAPTATAPTAIAGHIQRHDAPAWMTSAATAAPANAPVLNSACRRTSTEG
jgi:hypothetical protein